MLPQEAYQTKYLALLHPIVEVIIHEDGGPSKLPSIFKSLLHKDDSHIGPAYTQIEKNSKQSKKALKADKVPKEI